MKKLLTGYKISSPKSGRYIYIYTTRFKEIYAKCGRMLGMKTVGSFKRARKQRREYRRF